MIFKNNNVEVSIDASTGNLIIKHLNGASIEVLSSNNIGLKLITSNHIKTVNSANNTAVIIHP